MYKLDKVKGGGIQIEVEREERLRAITAMAIAIQNLSHALDNQTQVTIEKCAITASNPGIKVITEKQPTKKETFKFQK